MYIYVRIYICIYYYTHTHTHTTIIQSIKHLKENEKVFTRRGEEKKLKLELKNKKHKNVKVYYI